MGSDRSAQLDPARGSACPRPPAATDAVQLDETRGHLSKLPTVLVDNDPIWEKARAIGTEVHTPISIFLGGVQKAGTTSLFAHFCDHPAFARPSVKELHFFDDENHDWAAPNYSAIDEFFDPSDVNGRKFDATPIYIFWPPSIERIRAYNSEAKLIFLFRDPFDRAWSQWCLQFKLGYETMLFADAIRTGRQRLVEYPPLSLQHRLFSYIERGLYARQVERVLANFPAEQVLFLNSDDLLRDHAATLERIAAFLDLRPFPATGPKRENRRDDANYPCCPTEDDLELIANLVASDVTRFSQLTGIDVSGWKVMRGYRNRR